MTAEAWPELAGFPVVVRWPVQWGDQDAFGHVNNTIFFRWFETARIAYLERLGLARLSTSDPLGPILAQIGCNFRRQVGYPDWVVIGTRVTRLGRTSFGMEHVLVSEAQRAVAADGQSTIVVFHYERQRPEPIPDALRAQIEAMEGKSLGS